MATPDGGGALPPTRPNTGQVSIMHSQTGSSLARCCAPRVARGANLAKAQSQLEYTKEISSLIFQYHAGRCAACIPASATNPARQTASRVYGKNTLLYYHFLKRKIKFIASKVDSYGSHFDKAIKMSRRKIKSYKKDLKELIKFITRKYTSIYDDIGPIFYIINTRRALCAQSLETIMGILNDKQVLYDREIRRQFELLNSKLAPFAQDLDQHVKLLNSKIASYTSNLEKKIKRLRSRYSRFTDFAGRDFTGNDIL